MRNIRFGLVLDEQEHQALQTLIDRERATAASIIRRLIWFEARRLGFQAPMPAVDPESSSRKEVVHAGEYANVTDKQNGDGSQIIEPDALIIDTNTLAAKRAWQRGFEIICAFGAKRMAANAAQEHMRASAETEDTAP